MTRLSSLLATLIVSTVLALAAANASAQMQMTMHDHDQHSAMAAASQDDPDALSEGEITKVDKENGKLTIKHGPLTNLGMPGMTMAFKMQDPAMLDQVNVGGHVRFRVERINGTFIVTKLETSR